MRLFLHNLGCPKNQIEGEIISGWGRKQGILLTDDPQKAEAIVINTCSFIREAQEEAIEAILEAARMKSEGECRSLYVCGCFPQRFDGKSEGSLGLAAEFPEVDGFFGVNQWREVLKQLTGKTPASSANPFLHRLPGMPEHYAYLRIADGCDRECTYCVIPSIRGPYRSRPPAEIIEEAEFLAKRGVKELLPVAQELNSYGHDLGLGKKNRPLMSLLEQLCKVQGIEWIRPLYLHPPACDEGLFEFWVSQPRLCRYLDLPIEHASDRILKAMGRGGGKDQIRRLIHTARRIMDDVVIRTSVIVGFPGETQAEFDELLDFVREIRFERLGSFQYSAEEGTTAAGLPGQLKDTVIKQRRKRLMEAQSTISLDHNLKSIGTREEIYIDDYETDSGFSIGHSRKEVPELDGDIIVPGRYPVGSRLSVVIESAQEYDLVAKPIAEIKPIKDTTIPAEIS